MSFPELRGRMENAPSQQPLNASVLLRDLDENAIRITIGVRALESTLDLFIRRETEMLRKSSHESTF